MSELMLVKPSKELQEAIWEYRTDFSAWGKIILTAAAI